MAQIAVYERVPVYADVTLEPFSIIYVPIGGRRMRAYERKRSPSSPVDIATSTTAEPRPVATGGSIVPPAMIDRTTSTASRASNLPRRTRIETIPPPRTTTKNGIWIEFDGARWYHAGAVVSYNPDQFVPVGSYRGFPVYKEKNASSETVYVSVVKDGPLAPYSKR